MAKNKGLKKQPAKSTKNIFPPEADYNSRNPIFSFHHMRYGSECCLSRCDYQNKCSVVDKVLGLSQLNWYQIFAAPRWGNGQEGIPVKQFKVPMPSFVTPEVKELMVFHHSKVGRIAGFKEGATYHVLLIGDHLYKH